MRFQVEAPAMQRAIKAASLPLKRGHVPILECLHVVAKDNRLRLVGTNMDMEAQAQCEASVSDAGSTNVNAHDLARAIRGCKGIVTAILEQGLLRLEVTGANIALPVLADDFPRLSKPDGDAEIFGAADALKKLSPFMEIGQSARPHLAGVCLDDGSAVATTGKRLARFSIEGGSGQVIPGAAMTPVRKVLDADGRLFVGERTWRVEAENIALAGKLLDVDFPQWRRIAIARSPVCEFEAGDISAAMERATLGRAKAVFVEVKDGQMTITGEHWPERHIDAKASLRCAGEDMRFACYATDLSECVKVFPDAVVEMSVSPQAYRFSTPESPDDYTMMSAVADARNQLPEARAVA